MSIDEFYAGVGSRKAPDEILEMMRRAGERLARLGFILRSGAADGADSAFEAGCDAAGGAKEIFLPWSGFNKRAPGNGAIVVSDMRAALELAATVHPVWEKLTIGMRKLHARNTYQVLGRDLSSPVKFVLCWTPGAKVTGGTATAIKLAQSRGISVHNFASPETEQTVRRWLDAASPMAKTPV